jgi:hypothetical protein
MSSKKDLIDGIMRTKYETQNTDKVIKHENQKIKIVQSSNTTIVVDKKNNAIYRGLRNAFNHLVGRSS